MLYSCIAHSIEIFLHIFVMCSYQFNYESILTPGNFTESKSIAFERPKIKCWVLSTLKRSFLAIKNQRYIPNCLYVYQCAADIMCVSQTHVISNLESHRYFQNSKQYTRPPSPNRSCRALRNFGPWPSIDFSSILTILSYPWFLYATLDSD